MTQLVPSTGSPSDVLVLPNAGSFNAWRRLGTRLTASQAASSIFPLANLQDQRSGQRFIYPSLLADDWLQAETTLLLNASFDNFALTDPADWDVTETGTGAVTEETVTVESGSGVNLANGASGNAEIAQTFQARPGETLDVSFFFQTSNADSPSEVEIYSPLTNMWLNSAGQWVTFPTNWKESALTALGEVTGSFVVETDDEFLEPFGDIPIQVRLHMDNAAATRVHIYDEFHIKPRVDFVSVHSHNIDPRIKVRFSRSEENMSGVPVPASMRGGGTVDFEWTAGFDSEADTKMGTVSIFFELTGGDASVMTFIASDGNFFHVRRLADNTVEVQGFNSAATSILRMVSTNTLTAGGYHHIYATWDLAQTTGELWIDGVKETLSASTFTNDFIDYTRGGWHVWSADVGGSKMNADGGEFWFSMGHYVPNGVVRFRSSAGMAMYLGERGEAAVGAPPQLYLTGNDWTVNASGDGNPANVTGTPSYPVFLEATLVPYSPAFYAQLDAEVSSRFWRIWFNGMNSAQSGSISLGEVGLGVAEKLSRNPDFDFTRIEEIPQTVLQTDSAGERWTVKKEVLKRRTYELAFTQPETALTGEDAASRFERLLVRSTSYQAEPIIFVPDNTDLKVVIHAHGREVQSAIRKRAAKVQDTTINLVETSHGIVTE